MLYLAIDATTENLAGQLTIADIAVRYFVDIGTGKTVVVLMGAGGSFYGLRQRKLRRDTVARLGARVETLEKQIDPGRSSSKLTPRGETRPEDRR